MQSARAGAASVVLSDGKVLVAGGGDVSGSPGQKPTVTTEASAEVYSLPVASGTKPAPPAGAPAVAAASGLNGAPLVVTVVGGSVLILAALTGFLVVAFRRGRRSTGGTG